MNAGAPLIFRDRWLKHERQILNLYGQAHHSSERMHPRGVRLWKTLQSYGKRFVVDNHIDWEGYAAHHAFGDTAFILATTALNEKTKLGRLFEDSRRHRKAYRNVFHLGAEILEVAANGYIIKGHLTLDRLDEDFIAIFSNAKLTTTGDFQSPFGLQKPIEECPAELARLLSILRSELVRLMRKGVPSADDGLQKQIASKAASSCFSNYRTSVEVARLSLALLLIRDRQARKKFESQGSVNAFSDAGLIKDALFLGAGILTQDQGVRMMARFCSIKTCESLDASTATPKD